MKVEFETLPVPDKSGSEHALINIARILNLALRKIDYEPVLGSGGRDAVSWKGTWAAGNYHKHSMVNHDDVLYISNKATSETPNAIAVDWDELP